MAVIDDIMDQAALTDSIVGPVETEMETAPFIGEQIAPMQDTDSQYVSMRVEDLHAFGIGQFRAPEASIPLMDITGREEREEVIELAYLDEAHRISPRRWEILTQGGETLAVARGPASCRDRTDPRTTQRAPDRVDALGRILRTVDNRVPAAGYRAGHRLPAAVRSQAGDSGLVDGHHEQSIPSTI